MPGNSRQIASLPIFHFVLARLSATPTQRHCAGNTAIQVVHEAGTTSRRARKETIDATGETRLCATRRAGNIERHGGWQTGHDGAAGVNRKGHITIDRHAAG